MNPACLKEIKAHKKQPRCYGLLKASHQNRPVLSCSGGLSYMSPKVTLKVHLRAAIFTSTWGAYDDPSAANALISISIRN